MRLIRATAILVLVLGLTGSSAVQAETLALTGATLHPVSGPPIPQGVLLVEGDRIVAVGREVQIPQGAREVDLSGRHVYPTFLHPGTVLGLIEISSVRGTVDTTEIGEVNSHIRAEVAFNADSLLLDPAMSGGVLLAHVIPQGGTFAGTSALMRLQGWTWEEMTVKAPVGMHVFYPALTPPRSPFFRVSKEEFEKTKEKALKTLRETLADAQAYRKAKEAAAAGEAPEPAHNPRLEALLPVLDGTLPLFLHADEKRQIEGALEWAKEEGLTNLILVAGPDAQYLADRLAEEEIPVILNDVLRLPGRRWEPYDAPFTAAARLHEAGVRFCIGDGMRDASNARNLPFHAAMAAAFGLPKEMALRSVTLSVAEILGVADRLGSLEPGKEATFIATDGDPLEIRTRVERAWLAGREVDLTQDRQKRLYERYRNRPAGAPSSPE